MAVMFESSLTNDFFLQFLSKQVEAAERQRFLPVLLPAGLAQEGQQPPGLSWQGPAVGTGEQLAALAVHAGFGICQSVLWGREIPNPEGLGSHLTVTGCCPTATRLSSVTPSHALNVNNPFPLSSGSSLPAEPLHPREQLLCHPVLPLWGHLQGRGRACAEQPLPHPLLHLPR